MYKSQQHSAESVTLDFQTFFGIKISTEAVLWELHCAGFYGWKPDIATYNAKPWMELWKACHRCSLQQWK